VDVLDNIERIAAPLTPAIAERYVARGLPFICTSFVRDWPFAIDRASVVRAFGSGEVRDPSGTHRGTVEEYMSLTDFNRGSVTAVPPREVIAQLDAIVHASPIGSETQSVVWLGHAGCLQRFHCDMDCHDNFFVQVLGTKRVSLVSPEDTQKLSPSLDHRLLFCEVPFQFFSDAEKLAFLRFANGRDCLLEPGEMLYIPPLWWHAIEYLTDSLSVSWRTTHAPLLALASTAWPALWPSEWPLWQGIVSRISSDPESPHVDRAKSFLARLHDPETRVASELRTLHDEVCRGRYERPLTPADRPFFDLREQRPRAAKQGAWRPDEVPQLLPYIRIARVAGALIILDGARVLGEIELDDAEAQATTALIAELERGERTVAELGDLVGWALDDVGSVLDQLAEERWLGS
jgi:Cupin-like domain